MKKVYLILTTLTLVFSCADIERPNLGVGSQWLQFANGEVISEAEPQPFQLEVLYAAEKNPNGLDVSFSYTASSTEGYTISPSNGVVNIPAGEFVGYITITPINDEVTSDDIVLDFSFENVSLPVGINGEGVYNTTAQVTIVEDDCPLDLTQFIGTYTAEEDGYCVGCYEVEATLDEANQVLFLSNLYGTGGNTAITLDNSDPTNPSIDFVSEQYGAVLYVHSTYGNLYAVNPSQFSGNPAEDISSFRTCSQYMDLYFIRHVSAGYFTDLIHIQLYKN